MSRLRWRLVATLLLSSCFWAAAAKPDSAYVRADASGLIRERYRPLAAMMARTPAQIPTGGNNFEIITEGSRKLDLIVGDLQQARSYVLMEYFHYRIGPLSQRFGDLLMEKSRSGISVSYIHEDLMNIGRGMGYYRQMRESGIQLQPFSQKSSIFKTLIRINNRNHQKILVFDGAVGYTGGMNIAEHYFGSWKDTHLRITGPAVASMQDIFMDNWSRLSHRKTEPSPEVMPAMEGRLFLTLPPPPSATPPPDSSLFFEDKIVQIVSNGPDRISDVFKQAYIAALDSARQYFYLHTPYFVPPRAVFKSMKAASRRGVDVRVIIPEASDVLVLTPANRSYYKACLKAGIKVYERLGQFNHTKSFVTDGYLSCLGSVNFDFRSMKINMEDNAYIYDEDVAAKLVELYMEEIGQSAEVTDETISSWTFFGRVAQWLCRLLAPEL